MKPETRLRLIEARKHRQWSQQEVANRLGTTQHNVSRWERGATTPTAYFQVQLCALFDQTPQQLGLVEQAQQSSRASAAANAEPAPRHPPPPEEASILWAVPYPRNCFFTGRDQTLQFLHAMLQQQNGTIALTQPYALHGLGGIGKTQIALEYAYRYASAYTAILWVNTETSETLLASFVSLAEQLKLSEQNEQDQSKIRRALTCWLGEHQKWLLVCDNVEDLTLLQTFLPAARQGSILITTRLQAVGTITQQLRVDPLSSEEGLAFLLQRAKVLTPEMPLVQLTPVDLHAAQVIVEQMDGLPLALDQAGAYIEETQCSLDDYFQQYTQRRARFLERRGQSYQNHPTSMQTTLSLSFHQVEQQNKAAAEILQFCAFLAPDAIPEALITAGFSPDSQHLQRVLTDPWLLDEAIAVLGTFSLIHRDPAAKMLGLHRLVQAVLQDRLSAQEKEAWIKRVITALNRTFPTVTLAIWSQCEHLMPHVFQCVKITASWETLNEELAELFIKAGQYLIERGRYQEAEPLLRRVLRMREQELGTEHPEVASTLHMLGNLLFFQGNYTEAESLYQQALCIRERVLGTEHLLVSHLLNNLGFLYSEQGRYAVAEPTLKRALHIRENVLGPEHRQVAETLNNLGLLYNKQGRYSEAEPALKQSIQLREQAWGYDHPSIVNPLINLGILYYEQKQYMEAESVLQRALRIREQSLGIEHPDLAYPLTNLGMVYKEQGKYADAETVLKQALHIRERALGTEHPQVAYPLHCLGTLFLKQRKYQEAEALLQRALCIREITLDIEHPDRAESLFDLAYLYLCQRESLKAQHYYQQATAIWEKALGLNHPLVVMCLEEYAQLAHEQEDTR